MPGSGCLCANEMNPQRSIAIRRLATLLLVAVWFVASNHCALGLMQGARMAKDHAGCCSHGKPEKKPVNECCKALLGMLPATAKVAALHAAPEFAPEWPAFVEKTGWMPAGKIGGECFETGPPRESRSFAELVLQRSLRAHAPPCAV